MDRFAQIAHKVATILKLSPKMRTIPFGEGSSNEPDRAAAAFDEISKNLFHLNGPFYILNFKDGPVTLEIKPSFGKIRLSFITVPDKYRGKGLASKALKFLNDIADKHGVTISLDVSPQNEGGLSKRELFKWYERHGFRRLPYEMQKRLSDEMEREPQSRTASIAERIATRPIRLDRNEALRAVDRVMDEFRKGYWGRHPEEPIGSSFTFVDKVKVRAVDGSEFDVQVQYKSKKTDSWADTVLGGGSGTTTITKKPAVLILLNGNYTPTVFITTTSAERFRDEMMEVLEHELTHQADTYKELAEKTTQRIHTEAEVDLKEYYNRPAEVRGYMRSVYEEVLAYLPKIYPHFTINEIMKRLAFFSPMWKRISPHMTEENKKLLLKGVFQAIQDWVGEQSMAKAAGMNRLARIVERVASGQMRQAGLFEPPPRMVDDIAAWVFATAAYREKIRLKFRLDNYEKVDWSKVDFKDISTAPDSMSLGDWTEMEEVGAEAYIKEMKERVAKCDRLIADSPKPVKMVTRKDEKAFKIDLTGWKYLSVVQKASPENLKEANRIYPSVKVTILMTDDEKGYSAAWYYVQRRMEVIVSPLLSVTEKGDNLLMRDMMSSIEHELEHFAQDYLARVVGSTGKVGLPPRKTLTPDIDQHLVPQPKVKQTDSSKKKLEKFKEEGISEKDLHDLDDVEFYMVLRKTIDDVRDNLKYFKGDKRQAALRSMLGEGEPIRGAYPSSFIQLLKKHAPGKWRKAVAEIMKAVGV